MIGFGPSRDPTIEILDSATVIAFSAFQRLAEVTQVLAPDEGHVFHYRLTHSLKVAQFGRRLAEKLALEQAHAAQQLDGVDPEVVEAAALGHDLGHPPFGHVGEEELNGVVTQAGLLEGYEGNAQSFRIVTRLARRSPDHEGLNLTRASLAALLKYPWLRAAAGEQRNKWGSYNSEEDVLLWARASYGHDRFKSAEAELMDWADDVTYAVHDVADFFRTGLIPPVRLGSSDDSERQRFLPDCL